jgi:chemotaxis protein CheC
MTPIRFTAEQTDAMQEVINIAMGQAVASLANILDDVRVDLSVPHVHLVRINDLLDTIQKIIGATNEVTVVTQAFYNHLKGEVLVIFEEHGWKDLAGLMGYEQLPGNRQQEHELLLDVANIVTGACLNGIVSQLGTDLSYTAPSLISDLSGMKNTLISNNVSWTHALLVEVNFSLEHINFKSHLLILMTEDSIAILSATLDELLESI